MTTYTFNDIAGYETAKNELKGICKLLNEREKYLQKGAKIPKGLILYGEAGTGKTLFAKVLASECRLPFINIDLTDAIEPKDINKKIKDAFLSAKANADLTLVFIDEIDKILPDEGRDYVSDQSRRVLTQLLTLIDGITGDSGVFFVATCNEYDLMPHSLVRAGRIDKKIHLGLPNLASRVEILKHYAKKTECKFEMPFESMAKLCLGFSGASLETFINESVICSDDNNFIAKDVSYKKINEISNDDICDESVGRNTEIQAVHNVGHFIVARALKSDTYILDGDDDFMGNDFFLSVLNEYDDEDDWDDDDDCDDEDDYEDGDDESADEDENERHSKSEGHSSKDFMNLLSVIVGGYIAEKVFFGVTYDDCAIDFKNLENTLYMMSINGMLGYEFYYTRDEKYPCGHLQSIVDKRKELVAGAMDVAEKIIRENKRLAEYLVSLLMKNMTIEDKDLEPLIELFETENIVK